MAVMFEQTRMVSIPINSSGLIKLSDLRDFIEATDDAPEDVYVMVLSDELRYEVGT